MELTDEQFNILTIAYNAFGADMDSSLAHGGENRSKRAGWRTEYGLSGTFVYDMTFFLENGLLIQDGDVYQITQKGIELFQRLRDEEGYTRALWDN